MLSLNFVPPTLRIRLLLSVLTPLMVAIGSPASAHEGHRNFSQAFIDPLITHHAVLEDEFKFNSFVLQGKRVGEAQGLERMATLELAYALNDEWGFEAFIPVRGLTLGSQFQSSLGLGDLEIDPIKFSFLQQPDLVMTATLATTLPTGDVSQGLGDGKTILAPHLLIDSAFGPWAWQSNLAVEATVMGEAEAELELNSALSHSIHVGGHTLSPLVELNLGQAVLGDESGMMTAYVTPGIKWATQGWHVGIGARLPVTAERDADWVGMFQVGYHVSWSDLVQQPRALRQTALGEHAALH